MKKLTTITIASIAGAALVLGGVSSANAYPAGQTPTLVSNKTSGVTAGSSISVGVLNVQEGTVIEYFTSSGQSLGTATGAKYIAVPNLAGNFKIISEVKSSSYTPDIGKRDSLTIAVGKIIKSISIKASTSKPKKGKSVTLSGVVTPKTSGIVIKVSYKKKGASSYTAFSKASKSKSKGKWSKSFKLSKGVYSVKATTGDSKFSAKSSKTVKVTFK